MTVRKTTPFAHCWPWSISTDITGGQVGDSPPDQINSTAFSATWAWDKSINSVHSYPNAYLESSVLPLQLMNLSSLVVDVDWSYKTANSDESVGHVASANVAVDMFVDGDPTQANSTDKPEFEVMVWLGDYGAAHPIGFAGGVHAELKLRHSGNL